MSAYEWKTPGLYKVDANVAGKELERIYKRDGKIEPSVLVEESRPEDAPLHDCFEWDDKKAADAYRKSQARGIMCNVMIVGEPKRDTYTRAIVNVCKEYRPLKVVLQSKDMTQELLRNALRDLKCFETKYRELSELAPVFDAIQKVAE